MTQPGPSAGGTSAAGDGAARPARLAEASSPSDAPGDRNADAAGDGKTGRVDRFLWGQDGLTFGSLLRALNPLQHIPVVSTIYEELTGDRIGAVARAIGGTLIGGPVGLISSLANSLFEAGTGKDLGGHVMASLFGGDDHALDGSGSDGQGAGAIAQAPDGPLPQGAVAVADLPWLSGTSAPAEGGATGGGAGAPAGALASGTVAVAGLPWSSGPGNGTLTAQLAGTAGQSAAQAAAAGARQDPPPVPTPFVQSLMRPSPVRGVVVAPANGNAVVPAALTGSAGRQTAPPDFALRMMDALDKYRAAAKLHGTAPATLDVGG